MTFALVLLYIHSYIRWILLAVLAIALVKHVIGWVTKAEEYDAMSRGITSAMAGLMDLNVLIGLVQLAIRWQDYAGADNLMPYLEHTGTLIVAAVLGHLPSLWKEKPAVIRYRNISIVVVFVTLLIVAAVMSLPGSRWVLRGLN